MTVFSLSKLAQGHFVMIEVPSSKRRQTQMPNISQPLFNVTLVNVPLAKESHMTKPRFKGLVLAGEIDSSSC